MIIDFPHFTCWSRSYFTKLGSGEYFLEELENEVWSKLKYEREQRERQRQQKIRGLSYISRWKAYSTPTNLSLSGVSLKPIFNQFIIHLVYKLQLLTHLKTIFRQKKLPTSTSQRNWKHLPTNLSSRPEV